MTFALSSRVTRTIAALLAVALIGGGVAGGVAATAGHAGNAHVVVSHNGRTAG